MRSSGEPVSCFVDNKQFSRIAVCMGPERTLLTLSSLTHKPLSYLTLEIFCLNSVSQGTTRSARGVWRPNTSPH
jgi:hypothetical protein